MLYSKCIHFCKLITQQQSRVTKIDFTSWDEREKNEMKKNLKQREKEIFVKLKSSRFLLFSLLLLLIFNWKTGN